MARILLVEDEPAINAGVQDDLELEGYSAELAADGVAAQAKGLAEHYDLIVLDIHAAQTRWIERMPEAPGGRCSHARHYADGA